VPLERSGSGSVPTDSAAEYEKLRSLLVGPERVQLDAISEELRSRAVKVEDLAEKLPEAIALRASRDEHLGRALSPTIDTALRDSIRRDPREIASAIFPIIGPAIRKAIAEAMSGLVRSINSAVEQSLSAQGMKWRVEAWRSGVPYPQVVLKHALVYRVEQAFLIHADTGLLIRHVSAPDLKVTEADLISGMLSAIGDFVRDSFKQGEGATLRTFSVGDHTVQVEAGPRALLALVIRGQPPETLLVRQQDTLETVHLEFATQLAEFSGNAAKLAGTEPLLESCLETVLSTDTKKRSRLAFMKWAIPLMLVVGVLAALYVRSRIRWNQAIDTLRNEPGLVVVDASRGWRSWDISGLKDPIAREPAAVLSGAGITPRSLGGRWEGYLSLDPEIVEARRVSSRDSLGTLIERERILFDPGSSDLGPAATATLGALIQRIQQLDGIAATKGESVRLSLTGRTDRSGADATNTTLAEQRVSRVAAFLAENGIDPGRLIPDPVATRAPLAAPDSVTSARVNRSVSFNVTVSPASSGRGGSQ
jgi:outer membrane protein OmpA-like peptidoglycan-associated protein